MSARKVSLAEQIAAGVERQNATRATRTMQPRDLPAIPPKHTRLDGEADDARLVRRIVGAAIDARVCTIVARPSDAWQWTEENELAVQTADGTVYLVTVVRW